MLSSDGGYSMANYTYCSADDAVCSACRAEWTQDYAMGTHVATTTTCTGASGCICLSVCELPDRDDRAIASCVGTARSEQLSSYVASPALLFIGDEGGATVPGFDLSPANTAKIAGAAALVLALTVGASVLAGALASDS